MTDKHQWQANVREATEEDIPAICDLLLTLFEQEEEFVPNRETHIKGIARIIDQPEYGTFIVAEIDRQVIGVVSLLYQISTALGGVVAILEDFVVYRDSRGQGYGHQLLSTAIDMAKSKGCLRITLLTDGDNQRAKKLYQHFGFENSQMTPMRLTLTST